MAQPDSVTQAVRDPQRLQELYELDLLDSAIEDAFDRLTRLASKVTGSPVSLISLVDADRQFFKSLLGLPEPVASARETPLSHSFCQHVVASGKPLIVEDARKVSLLQDNLAITDLNVVGYLGMPLTTASGQNLGSFCVIDNKPRQWSEEEIEIVRELALSTMTEIELRAEIVARKNAESELIKRNRQYQRAYRFAESTLKHMQDSVGKGADRQEILVYIQQMQTQLERL